MSTDKAIFEMFETINKKLDKRPDKPTEPVQVDMTAVNAVIERLESATDEIGKPTKVEHRHKIDFTSNWVFISMVVMAFAILGLSYVIGNQRQTINQYKNNDLKYRYIKMQGQTDEESFSRLERRFLYGDTIKIIRKQVEKYEELVKEQPRNITDAAAFVVQFYSPLILFLRNAGLHINSLLRLFTIFTLVALYLSAFSSFYTKTITINTGHIICFLAYNN